MVLRYSYDGVTQKYGVYFPSVEETVSANINDEDLELMDDDN